jgi:hypothetical protein
MHRAPPADVATDPVHVHDRARRALRSSQRVTGAECGSQARRVPASVGLDKLLHFAATMMLSAGVPLKVVSVFGHAGVAIKGGTCGDVSRAFLGRRWLGSATHSHEKRWSKRWSNVKTILKHNYFDQRILHPTRSFTLSGWRDLNPRPLDPQIGGDLSVGLKRAWIK